MLPIATSIVFTDDDVLIGYSCHEGVLKALLER